MTRDGYERARAVPAVIASLVATDDAPVCTWCGRRYGDVVVQDLGRLSLLEETTAAPSPVDARDDPSSLRPA